MQGKIRTAVCWMLTESDNRTDGKKTKYIGQSKKYRKYDPKLFDTLQECLSDLGRDVQLADRKNVVPSAIYFPEMLTDNAKQRAIFFADFQLIAKESDLIFFDPDNGLEVKSVKYGFKESSKYLYWNELIDTFKAGHSVLLYQHFPRAKRDGFREQLFREVCDRLGIAQAILFTTSNVLFILIPQEKHFEHFSRCSITVDQIWGNEIKYSCMKLEKNLILEAVYGGEMTEQEVESVAQLLFGWWKRNHENISG